MERSFLRSRLSLLAAATVCMLVILSGTAFAAEPTAAGALQPLPVTAARAQAAKSLGGGVSQAALYQGYVWLDSHTNGATYSYPRGNSIYVQATGSDPDGWQDYLLELWIVDATTDEILAVYGTGSYVNGSQTASTNLSTSGWQISSGRYEVYAVLWDDWNEYIEDYEYFRATITAPPADSVSASIGSISDTTPVKGDTVNFSGSGTSSLGHSINAYQWRSSLDGTLSSSSSFSTSSLSVGTHTIYFKAGCSQGHWSPETSTKVTVTGLTGLTAVEGQGRYGTAVAASKAAFTSADTVVIATGESFADALGGAGLAGAVNGPLLLTQKGTLPAEVGAEITRLGATKAYVLGGTNAVSAAVENALKAKVGADGVERIAGASRFATAYMVAEETIEILGPSYSGTAFVATGMNFPDALGAAPISAAAGVPVLLANPTAGTVSLPETVTAVYICGGTNAVPSTIENSLKTKLGSSQVTRVAGSSRFDTAAQVAQIGVSTYGMGWDGVGVTTGMNFPDALAAGPVLGQLDTVMLLTATTAPLPSPTSAKLAANADSINSVHFFGGASVVPVTVRNAVANCLH